MMLRVVRTAFMLAVVAGVSALVRVPVVAASDEPELFMTHVHFEAIRSLRRKAVDPQVFVREKQGFRPARGGDDPSTPLYTAQGNALLLNLGHWVDAKGSARFYNGPGESVREVKFSFADLVPFGLYSIFVSRSTPDTVEIAPFAKETESLKASIDGTISLVAHAEMPLLDGDLIWLVYHSDGSAHGNHLGDLGVTAHEQLILPVRLAVAAAPRASAKVPFRPAPTPSPTPSPSPTPTPSATPVLSPTPAPSGSPFLTPPPEPVSMVSQSEATPPCSTPTAPAPPSADDDDLYVPVDHASTPAPAEEASPAPASTLTPAPAGSANPAATAAPATSPTPEEAPTTDDSPTPERSARPEESPRPMPTEPTF